MIAEKAKLAEDSQKALADLEAKIQTEQIDPAQKKLDGITVIRNETMTKLNEAIKANEMGKVDMSIEIEKLEDSLKEFDL